ncbi:uncharacterized protein G2W53_041258 [Senna tora]|uniref:Uncharacterized protein n=1 Tax=Senna tora TaxID=362788 RepID=A0A834VYJ2_9FABA|nr:uncharacterized protein G2W53_041258 [Senna tora]
MAEAMNGQVTTPQTLHHIRGEGDIVPQVRLEGEDEEVIEVISDAMVEPSGEGPAQQVRRDT